MSSEGREETLSKTQHWALVIAGQGHRVVRGRGYEVHTSFKTGEVHYGCPWQAYDKCLRQGLLTSDGITDLGRAALRRADPPADGEG